MIRFVCYRCRTEFRRFDEFIACVEGHEKEAHDGALAPNQTQSAAPQPNS